MEKFCSPSPPVRSVLWRQLKPGVSIKDFISTKFSRTGILRGGCMYVCLRMSENVSLDSSSMEIIFISDKALDCFRPQDIGFLVIT